jgi:hypothetical protein
VYDLLQRLFVGASLYTALPFPRYLFSNIMLLPLYRSLPYGGARSRYVASAVLNSDGSDGCAVIGCRLNKE